jgi:pyruvate/2-oxoglutarate dehydrogenase complex dihydrolipoamide dehydrogenase (E3) component
LDLGRLAARIHLISSNLANRSIDLLESQRVEILNGRGRFTSPNTAIATVDGSDIEIEFDVAVVSTGSAPRIPDWADVDGERILTTRHAYNLRELPEHIVIIGSGVTGVEMVHIFESLGSKVTLLVSRQQVLPHKDAEVAAALESEILERGIKLLKGARAEGIDLTEDGFW